MSSDRQYIDRLIECYELEIDTPSAVVDLRREPPEEGVPTELDVLFYEIEEAAPAENSTMMMTAGLSSRPMAGAYERVEIGYEFSGIRQANERRPLARSLAHLGTAALLDRQPFEPGLILENLRLPPFDRMDHGLVTHWPLLAELFIAGTDPEVLLLRIIPLFESEARFLAARDAVKGLSELRAHGLDYLNPEREPAV